MTNRAVGTLFVGLKLGAYPNRLARSLSQPSTFGAAMRLVATVYHDDDWAVSPSGQAVAMATSWQREDRLRLIDTATTAVRWERSMEDWTESWSGVVTRRAVGGPVARYEQRHRRRTSTGTVGNRCGQRRLHTCSRDSAQYQGFSTFLEWSGDDESILTGIPARLVRADDGTMVPFPVPAEDGLSVLVWSPDGQHILRWSVDSAELTIWPPDGREETPLGQGLIWSGSGSRGHPTARIWRSWRSAHPDRRRQSSWSSMQTAARDRRW